MMSAYDVTFDELLAEGADFFSVFDGFVDGSLVEQTLFGLSDDELAAIVE